MGVGQCHSKPLPAAVLCLLLAGVGAGAVQLTHEARLRVGAWGAGPTQRCVGLGMWLLPHRQFSQLCPHLCLSLYKLLG